MTHPNHSRWIDQYPNISQLIEKLKDFSPAIHQHVGRKCLKQINRYRYYVEGRTVVIHGMTHGLPLNHTFDTEEDHAARWYDKVPELSKAIRSIAILPEKTLRQIDQRCSVLMNHIDEWQHHNQNLEAKIHLYLNAHEVFDVRDNLGHIRIQRQINM